MFARTKRLGLIGIFCLLALLIAVPVALGGSASTLKRNTWTADQYFLQGVDGKGKGQIVGLKQKVSTADSNTTSVTVKATDAGTIFVSSSNESGTTFSLPADPTGLMYTFVCGTDSSEIRIDPNSTDYFAGLTAGTYYASASIGDGLTILGISSTTWIIISSEGSNWHLEE